MTIQQAIEKAIEGGYHRGQIGTSPIVEINCDFAITETKGERNHYGLAWVWLDPLFWQSLGKAMGWNVSEPQVTRSKVGIEGGEFKGYVHNGYVVHWIDFVEHLAEGKDAESFFESLTN